MATRGYVKADFGTRLLAIFIDGLILGLISGLLFGTAGEIGGGISFLIGMGYNWFFWTRNDGQTPGKRIMNLRVIKADGTRLRDTDALIRYVGYYVNTMIFLLGWLWALIDSNGRGWHDILAGTIVVEA